MYLRYFAWNFIGQGTVFGPDRFIIETFSPKGLFFMPFLLGIAGVWHHFKNDLPRAFAILILFIFTGIMIVLYLNQPDPQPRERDYVYVGSFFAFSIWIGIGISWIIAKVGETFRAFRTIQKPAVLAAFSLCLYMGPAIEFDHNFDSHDRRGNYMAWDYGYNILQSCEKDGIIFTNGDNDTFPIWYLQEVEGIRKDVNIVNLSLLNTNWYIKQLKYGNPAVPVTLSDNEIEAIAPRVWTERSVTVPVPASAYNTYSKDVHEKFDLLEITADTVMSFNVAPTFTTPDGNQTGLRVQDILLEHIIRANNWERPVYIAMTVSEKNKLGLHEYLRTDGLAFKLVPFSNRYLAVELLTSNIIDVFRYRGYNDPDVYFDRTQKDMLQNLRVAFFNASNFYSTNQMVDEAARLLGEMEQRIPADLIPFPDYRTRLQIAQLYFRNNEMEKVDEILDEILAQDQTDIQSKKDVARIYAVYMGDYRKAAELLTEYLQVNPFEPDAYSLLISALRDDNKYTDALLYIRKWLDQYPNDTNAQSLLKNIEQLQANADSTE